jgi:Phosphotransferase enzyme family
MGGGLNVWGSGAHRPDAELVDGAVLKQAGRWSAGVIALLRHLADIGFDGAPRVIGDGLASDGRLAVTFVPGASPHPNAWWSEEAVGAVGALLRRLHDATVSFVPPEGVRWQSCWLRDLDGADRVIGHCDTGPWNVVATQGRPTAFIDWEYAGPVDRWWELAAAVWLNAQLHDDDVAERNQLPDAATRARHVRAMFDGYGVPRRCRPALLDRLVEVPIHAARGEAIDGGVTPESTAGVTDDGYPLLWAIAWRVRSAAWIARHRGLLERHACALP